MRQKPRIEKRDGSWRVVLPTFGFLSRRDPHNCVVGFTSQPAALRWLEAHYRYRTRSA